jgi:hypothetical protein
MGVLALGSLCVSRNNAIIRNSRLATPLGKLQIFLEPRINILMQDVTEAVTVCLWHLVHRIFNALQLEPEITNSGNIHLPQFLIGMKRVSPPWGRVWGTPKRRGFRRKRFELYSKDTTISVQEHNSQISQPFDDIKERSISIPI